MTLPALDACHVCGVRLSTMSDSGFRVNVRGISRYLWDRVKNYCWEHQITLGQFVTEALEMRLRK